MQQMSIQQEAANEKTSSDRLFELAHISTELAQLVAKNSCTPPELLRELGNSSDIITRQNVAANPNTPTEVLLDLGAEFSEQLLDNPIFSLLLLENPNLVNEISISTLISFLKQEKVPISLLEQAINRRYDATEVLLDDVFNEKASTPKPHARLGMALAMNAQTPPTVLEELIECWDSQVQEAARLHVNWAGEMQQGWDEAACEAIQITTLEYNEREYIRHLANRGLIPARIINQLVRHKDIRLVIAAHPNTSLKRPKHLAKNNDVSQPIACNPNIPVELLEQLAQNQDGGIRLYVAMNPNTPVQLLELLAQDKTPGVRIHVAKNPNAPVQLLELFAQDEDKWIRRTVASNPNTPLMLVDELLKQLAQDENHAVREFVAGHPKTPVSLLLEVTLKVCPQDSTPCLSRFLVLLYPQASYQAIGKYYCSEIWLERYAIAQNSNTPLDILHTLAKDANRIVRAAAKANLERRHQKP